MLKPKEPRSRHQNDGDGGFNAPRGFADAATESRTGLTVFDDDWTTANVPAAAAIAAFHEAPKAGPIMRDGKMVGWGYPGDDEKLGAVAPPQGLPETKCRVMRHGGAAAAVAAGAAPPAPVVPVYDWSAYQNYAPAFGGPPPPFGAGRGGPPPGPYGPRF